MSMGSRLFNAFAAPGELFTWLAGRPFSVVNWIVPSALAALVGVIVNIIIFSQPALVDEIRGMQFREIQRRVEQGKMRQQDADQAKEAMNGIGMAVVRVAAPVVALITAMISPFWWGLFAWLVGRVIFRAPMGYMRGVEIASFAGLIVALGLLVGMFLAVGTGRLLAGPHLGCFLSELDLGNRLHLTLVALNLFYFWQVGVLATGISKLANRPWLPVAVVFLGLWAGYKGTAILLGLAQFAL